MSHNDSVIPPADATKRLAWRWPAIIVALLAAHVVGMLVAVSIISRRPGESAVIPDYYAKEQAWDSHKQQLLEADRLGWNVDLQPTGQTDVLGRRQMLLKLTTAGDKPVADADATVRCFHLSHGDEAETLTPNAVAPGQFALTLPAKYSGFWQFELTATAGGRTFVKTLTQYVN
ncbi:MAG: FixH family protein [Tepidisphaeraceae bacterium]|jgi:hypothetical protein